MRDLGLDILDLKNAAALHIKKSLASENVLSEIFSIFSSKHDEIYEAELKFVKERWASVLSLRLVLLISINEAIKTKIRSSPNFRGFVENLSVFRVRHPHIAILLFSFQ
jgi:hypothetical protein